MTTLLFNVIISPIEYFIENIFTYFVFVLGLDIVSAIFFMSFVVTMLCLPFYYRADIIHKEEESKLLELQPYIRKIKKSYKGDEQFFLLKTLYRQHNYSPIMSLRHSFYLFLQIPFFIAAYHFFSNLDILNGLGFGIFEDFSQPDSLLKIGGKAFNVLPFIMTVINIISCEIYLKGKNWKTRIQPYCFAVLFLVLLYDSPSALVMYWTYNNFFYLLKNFFMKDDKPQKFVICLLSIGLILLSMYRINIDSTVVENILEILLFALPFLVVFFFFKYLCKILNNYFYQNNIDNGLIIKYFFLCCIGLVLLQGIQIPVGIMSSDLRIFATEFGGTGYIINLITENIFSLIGLYLFWGSIILYLMKKEHRTIFTVILISAFLFSLFNYLNFGSKLGTIDTNLKFESNEIIKIISGGTVAQILNILIFMVILLFIAYALKKTIRKYVAPILTVLIMSEIAVSCLYLTRFSKEVGFINDWEKNNNSLLASNESIELSKTGNNVIVICLDRFLGCFLPVILNEKPELKKIYSGFVFYPNTVSFYGSTVLGYPPCAGGYEYTPWKLDKDERNFGEKWLESSLMMLTLFKNNNYRSTAVDPIGGYDFHMRFYKNYKNFSDIYTSRGLNYVGMVGKYNNIYQNNELKDDSILIRLKKKLYLYSFFNIAPKYSKKLLYCNGLYLTCLNRIDLNSDIYYSEKALLNNYSSLAYLNKITNVGSENNTFTMIHNNLPHCLNFLQYPDYKYSKTITNIGPIRFKDKNTEMAYHTAMAAALLVGEYFEYLKEAGVYNNSRIIIVADHGNKYVSFPGFNKAQNDSIIKFNPLLLVKDFNSNFDFKSDNTFMTNADVPYLATKDIISEPKNPFTGNIINVDDKAEGIDIYMDLNYWNASEFIGSKVILDENPKIMHVKDNIFEANNWKKVEKK